MKNGIDTSRYQGSRVDYYKAKMAGVDFVFLRIGAGQTKDSSFERNYASAVSAGLEVGVYFYTYSTAVTSAVADAERVLRWLNNRHLDFPVAYDLEDRSQRGRSRRTVNAELYNAFAGKIEADGRYNAILYTGEAFYNNYFNKDLIKDDLWIAKYSLEQPNVGREVTIWQYSSAKVVTPYYSGKLDRDLMLREFTGGNHVPVNDGSENPYPHPTRTLKRGSVGEDVKWMQYELNRRGFGLEVDGRFGPATDKALREFQRESGLAVDGKCGPATRRELMEG